MECQASINLYFTESSGWKSWFFLHNKDKKLTDDGKRWKKSFMRFEIFIMSFLLRFKASIVRHFFYAARMLLSSPSCSLPSPLIPFCYIAFFFLFQFAFAADQQYLSRRWFQIVHNIFFVKSDWIRVAEKSPYRIRNRLCLPLLTLLITSHHPSWVRRFSSYRFETFI